MPLTVLFPKLTSSLLQLLTQHPATRFFQAPLGDFRCLRCVSDVFLIRSSESGNTHPEKQPGNIPRPRSLQKFFQRPKTSEKNCFYSQVRGNSFRRGPVSIHHDETKEKHRHNDIWAALNQTDTEYFSSDAFICNLIRCICSSWDKSYQEPLSNASVHSKASGEIQAHIKKKKEVTFPSQGAGTHSPGKAQYVTEMSQRQTDWQLRHCWGAASFMSAHETTIYGGVSLSPVMSW